MTSFWVDNIPQRLRNCTRHTVGRVSLLLRLRSQQVSDLTLGLEQDPLSGSARTNCMSLIRHSSRRSIVWMGIGTSIPGPTMPSGPKAPLFSAQVLHLPPSRFFHCRLTFIDHDAHKARRRAIAPFFSKPNVIARQDLLHRNIEKLCQRISKLTKTTFNLGAAISAFTRDNANEFIIGKSYNELDLEDFGIGLSISSQGAGVFWRTTKHIRWFGPALRAMPIDWAMKAADEGTKSFLRYLQVSYYQ